VAGLAEPADDLSGKPVDIFEQRMPGVPPV
jgi:hypothetical protein